MRYREARESSETAPSRAMAVALGSVGVALVYVTTTTVIGFLSNLTSPLGVFRELGVVSAIGIVATLLVFGLSRSGVESRTRRTARTPRNRPPEAGHRNRERAGQSPPGYGGNARDEGPYVVIAVALLVSATGAYGATDIDASFEQSDFLAEDPDDWLKDLPDPIAPGRTRRKGRSTRSTVTSSDRTPQPRYSSGAT